MSSQDGLHRPCENGADLRPMGVHVRGCRRAAEPVPGSVEDAACLSCHGYVATETTERKGVRVRHKDFLELGARCRDCHNSTAHPNAVPEPSSPEMADCIVRHDGETVSADCEMCHPGDPLQYTASSEELPKVQDLDTSNCYGCHDEYAECLFCHGQTMPHPPGWGPADAVQGRSGDHANEGFLDRESCYRCHYSPGGIFEFSADNCQPCHTTPGPMHGGAPWVAEHGLQATGQRGGELSDCYTCHPSQDFCAGCHPASYAELYAPIGGADSYRRDFPKPPPEYFDYYSVRHERPGVGRSSESTLRGRSCGRSSTRQIFRRSAQR